MNYDKRLTENMDILKNEMDGNPSKDLHILVKEILSDIKKLIDNLYNDSQADPFINSCSRDKGSDICSMKLIGEVIKLVHDYEKDFIASNDERDKED